MKGRCSDSVVAVLTICRLCRIRKSTHHVASSNTCRPSSKERLIRQRLVLRLGGGESATMAADEQ